MYAPLAPLLHQLHYDSVIEIGSLGSHPARCPISGARMKLVKQFILISRGTLTVCLGPTGNA